MSETAECVETLDQRAQACFVESAEIIFNGDSSLTCGEVKARMIVKHGQDAFDKMLADLKGL